MNPSTETSGKPADIPQNVWDAAERIADANEPSTETLARTILAAKAEEREACAVERCAALADNAADQWEMYDEYERASEFRDLAAAMRRGDQVNTAHKNSEVQ